MVSGEPSYRSGASNIFATVPVELGSVPDHMVIDHSFAVSTAMAVLALSVAVYLAVRRERRSG